ncbi:MAG: 3-deoxy-D-manno-octulosonate 8-phosphate phosphatase [Flavipsychrobacter sp.]|nr:3-deoxy-D-manno-octulosonate 8-phosphate phosphatase [Flavipsychrobacter sp.]
MNILELFAPIRTFVLDVDGVLTNGSLLATEDGQLLRSMNIKDGYAIQLAIKKGYKVWILSGAKSEGVRLRLQKLGVKDVHIGIETKKELLQDIALSSATSYESVLYMGDDIPDYAAMQLCGLPCCPADAAPEIKSIARYISPLKGGEGCVRDVIEKVLKLNGDWDLPV